MLTFSATEKSEAPQRIAVEMESCESGKRVRLRLESYDAKLGWYPAGCLSLPLHQLPVLEQAIAEMRSEESSCEIIPFPLAAKEAPVLSCAEICKEPCQAALVLAPRLSLSAV
jgi:hypothetical protein